jgi:vacuolar-type H+-ATPase subunit F/Vma7
MDFHVLGEEEIVLGFAYAGVPGTVAGDRQGALEAFRSLTGQNAFNAEAESSCKVLIVTEDMWSMIGEELNAWQYAGRYPLIVDVPALAGHHPGRKTLVDAIREAIGIQV